MLKQNDKAKVLKKNEHSEGFSEIGRGVITSVFCSKRGAEPTFVGFSDKNWPNQGVSEILPVNSDRIKVLAA